MSTHRSGRISSIPENEVLLETWRPFLATTWGQILFPRGSTVPDSDRPCAAEEPLLLARSSLWTPWPEAAPRPVDIALRSPVATRLLDPGPPGRDLDLDLRRSPRAPRPPRLLHSAGRAGSPTRRPGSVPRPVHLPNARRGGRGRRVDRPGGGRVVVVALHPRVGPIQPGARSEEERSFDG